MSWLNCSSLNALCLQGQNRFCYIYFEEIGEKIAKKSPGFSTKPTLSYLAMKSPRWQPWCPLAAAVLILLSTLDMYVLAAGQCSLARQRERTF